MINKNLLNSASNKILNNKNVKKSVISIPANKDHKEIKEVKEIKVIKVSEKQRKSSVATVRATNINIENKQNKNENKKQSITTNHKDIDTISVNSALTVQTKATKSVNPDSRLSNKTEKTAVGNDNNLQSSRSNAKLSNIKEENQTNKKKIVFPNSKFEVNAEVYYPRASIKEKNKISLKNNPYTCNGEKKIDTFLDYEEMKKKLGRKNLILKFNNSKVKDPYLIKKVYEAYPLFFKVFEKIAQPLKYYTTEWRRFIREEV